MSAPAGELRLAAPGKVNLVLRVLGRRPDGFHELDTTLLALDRADELGLRLAPPEGVRLGLRGPLVSADVPADPSNLAARAAALALERARALGRLPPGCGLALELFKELPSRAGLGGGSSDAAAALLGAARLLCLDERDPELCAGLERLGSDCAFFLAARGSGLARCRGRGELVEPAPLPATQRALVVLVPEVGCSTARVYAAFRREDARAVPEVAPSFALEAPLAEARAALVNDLEPAALRSHPELARLRAQLDRCGAGHFLLCGSGSGYFGLFEDAHAATAFLREQVMPRKGRDYALRAAFVARPWRASFPA